MPKATATTTISTTAITYGDDYDNYYPWLFAPQLSIIVLFFFSFAFYINCILVGLYTTMPKTTAMTTISTTVMTTYSDDYNNYYPWLFAPPLSIIVHGFFYLFFILY